jgi:hypothetical protein
MPMTTVVVSQAPGVINSALLKHWYLDDPKPGSLDSSAEKSVKVRGWVVPQPGCTVASVVLQHGDNTFEFKLTEKRMDVARRFENLGMSDATSSRCGFNFKLNIERGKFRIGFKFDDVIVWGASIDVVVTLKVEEGTDGWLFLGNDTNRSMEQFSGKRLLTDEELGLWDQYFNSVRDLSKARAFKYSFVLAPAKEFCVPEHYPVQRGEKNTVDQFLALFKNQNQILWPRDELALDKEQTYWKGDTHWSDYGAYVTALLALNALELKTDPYEQLPPYAMLRRAGDLGGKLSPPKKFAVATADFSATNRHLVFDNEIHNHGRIRIYQYSTPKYPSSTCICFGDSFSVNLIPWLAPYFGRLIYVHSAAALDLDLLEFEKPTHVLFQTNSRFIINPPKIEGNLKESMTSKLKLFSDEKRLLLTRKCEHSLKSRCENHFYYELMLAMLESASKN